MIVGPRLIMLGLIVDTTKMTVSITPEYLQQVRDLLSNWDFKKRFFNVGDMQKLVGKLAKLGEGAPWIFKLMSYLYTSLVYALKNNKNSSRIAHKNSGISSIRWRESNSLEGNQIYSTISILP